MANPLPPPTISVVVIGLNEEAHLKASLDSIVAGKPENWDLEIIYVDSGSVDRSLEIANSVNGVQVLHLNIPRPSAAKGRNLGIRMVRGEFVQLVDGDSVLHPDWMAIAIAKLKDSNDIACVFGQCIEMHPDQSIYMRVCGLDWHVPPGDHRLCGGNAMWRTTVITHSGLFDESLQLGEEPDLCYRVRQQGHRIHCIDAPMVQHDLDMTRFIQYWRRGKNTGKAYARVALRYWRKPEKLWLREFVRNFIEPALWLVIFGIGWALEDFATGIFLLIGWWIVRAALISRTVSHRLSSPIDRLAYGLHCQIIRLPIFFGQVTAIFRR